MGLSWDLTVRLPVSWLVVSVDGYIHCPWRQWWEIQVLVQGNPSQRQL